MTPRELLLRCLLVLGAVAVASALVFASLPGWRAYRAASRAVVAEDGRAVHPARATAATGRTTDVPVADLRLVAARGSCWIVVRSGSASGTVRYAGTVAEGNRIRVHGARLWVRLGAAGNVEGRLNGHALGRLPSGTVNVVVTAGGMRLDPTVKGRTRSL